MGSLDFVHLAGMDTDMGPLLVYLQDFFAQRSDPGILAAYLFGSHAAGRAVRESDVDVAVLVDREAYATRRSRSDLGFELMLDLMSALHKNEVDVVILNDAPPELGRKVVQSGIRVHASSAESARAYQRDIQLRAADLDPFLRRARRSLLEHYVLR